MSVCLSVSNITDKRVFSYGPFGDQYMIIFTSQYSLKDVSSFHTHGNNICGDLEYNHSKVMIYWIFILYVITF